MEKAVEQLYREARRPLLVFFTHQGRLTVEQAEDVLQNTMMKIVMSAQGIRGLGNPTAWVWTIARNCMTDQIRTLARRGDFENTVTDDEWELIQATSHLDCTREAELSIDECVNDGIRKLGEQMPARAHALLLHLEGSSVQEIAEIIDRGYDATKQYLSECRRKLIPFVSHCTDLLAN